MKWVLALVAVWIAVIPVEAFSQDRSKIARPLIRAKVAIENGVSVTALAQIVRELDEEVQVAEFEASLTDRDKAIAKSALAKLQATVWALSELRSDTECFPGRYSLVERNKSHPCLAEAVERAKKVSIDIGNHSGRREHYVQDFLNGSLSGIRVALEELRRK